MSSRENGRVNGPPPAPTSAVTPAALPPPPDLPFSGDGDGDGDGVVGTIEGSSPVRQVLAGIDIIQQEQRYTSPTDSVIAFRNERRKQPRREETEEAPTLPARLTVNATPAATELFALRNFHS